MPEESGGPRPYVATRLVHPAAFWRCFYEPLEVLMARAGSEVVPTLAAAEAHALANRLVVGWVAYEAAGGLDEAFESGSIVSGLPLAWFAVYGGFRAGGEPAAPLAGLSPTWCGSLSRDDYGRKLAQIKAYIQAGDVYQVNFTQRLRTEGAKPERLFDSMYAAQPTELATFIDTGDWAVCSVSPELFFDLEGDRIISKPMKGTAPRGKTNAEDGRLASLLRSSDKERAENLMIVDMVRNDIGRIADVGSVHVSNMFEVERHRTVLQMTSTIEGRTHAPLVEVFRALFPPASVTGAPKIRATQVISELEDDPRGIYTGCIGVIGPGRRARFAVAIRVAVVNSSTSQAEYGVGGGITWDSDEQKEYEECRTKALVLSKPSPQFRLLETIRWCPDEGYFLLDRHLARLADSARYFGFSIDLRSIEQLLHDTAREFVTRTKVRLLVADDGATTCEVQPLKREEGPIVVALACEPIDESDVFLYHKTTYRKQYDEARRRRPGFHDVVLYNKRGEVTETTVANVVADINGRLVTPPVECGLLAGTLRGRLLEEGVVHEETFLIDDLVRSDRIFLVNSVRGWVHAILSE